MSHPASADAHDPHPAVGPHAHWDFVHPSSGDRLRIIPERGGLVSGWVCGGREILYFDQDRYADPSKSIRGGIRCCFRSAETCPRMCCLWMASTIPSSSTASRRISLGSFSCWRIRAVSPQLSSTDETLKAYPFRFLLEMELRLVASALEITTTVHNCGDADMPFSFGLHPYFNVGDLAQIRLTGLAERCFNHLEMAEAVTAHQLKRLPEGVDFLCRPSGPVSLIDDATGVILELQHQAPLNLTVVWTEPPRAMVCLEPWTGPRQSLVSGDRKLLLESGTNQTLFCRYTVS